MTESKSKYETIAVSRIKESKTNPRQIFGVDSMKELVSSIKEHGIVTPLLLRSKDGFFEVVAGSRRFRAAKTLNLETVPAIVKQLDDDTALELQVIENDQRADVHPLEQCDAYARLQKKLNCTLEGLAARLGKPTSHVAQRLRYATLISAARKAFLAGEIGVGHANQLARLVERHQKEALEWARHSTASALADRIANNFFLNLKQAPFDTADATLLPMAGSCMDCPKRTGSSPMLFGDVRAVDTCTDGYCFLQKCQGHVKRIVGTHPDALLLTVGTSGYYHGERSEPKGATVWRKAGAKTCDSTREGVVVEIRDRYPDDDQKAALGTVLKVCTDPKCKTHSERRPSSSGYTRSKEESRRLKARKLELRRRGAIFQNLAGKSFPVNAADHRAMLDWQISSLGHDVAKAVSDAMGWTAEARKAHKGTIAGVNFQEVVRTHLKKLERAAVLRWNHLLVLAHTDLWFYSHMVKTPPAKALQAKAKQAGVKIAGTGGRRAKR